METTWAYVRGVEGGLLSEGFVRMTFVGCLYSEGGYYLNFRGVSINKDTV